MISAHFINHGTVATNAMKKKIIKICKKSTEIKNPEDRYNADPEKKKKKETNRKREIKCKSWVQEAGWKDKILWECRVKETGWKNRIRWKSQT